jgi:hypothetical protein
MSFSQRKVLLNEHRAKQPPCAARAVLRSGRERAERRQGEGRCRALSLLIPILLGTAIFPSLAASANHEKFLAEKKEIFLLTVERVRTAHHDYQRAIKAAESRLRKLHEDYQVAKSTPPTKLDGDLQELQSAVHPVRFRRSRGRSVEPNPEATKLVEKYWSEYQEGFEKIRENIPVQRMLGKSDSQLYWNIMQRYDDLRARAGEKLIYNSPAGAPPLEEVLRKNEWTLLKEVENPAALRTKGSPTCVVAPEQHPRNVNIDIAPFYHSQGMLPTVSPARAAAFEVPPGCRTVTLRDAKNKIIVRVSRGKGVAHIGSSQAELAYGYVLIPPDTAYSFENTTSAALELEYIAVPQ